jgi:hypothetical protein
MLANKRSCHRNLWGKIKYKDVTITKNAIKAKELKIIHGTISGLSINNDTKKTRKN